MKKIIVLKAGDKVPDGAVFLYAREVQEFSHHTYSLGIFWDTRTTWNKKVTYLYYEVSI